MPTLSEFVAEEYFPVHCVGFSENTKRLYRNTLNNFKKFLCRVPELSDLNDKTIRKFMGWHIARGRSPETANKDAGQLVAIWNIAARERVVECWPTVKMLKVPYRMPLAWLEDEIPLLIRSARQEKRLIGKIRGAVWWPAILLTSIGTAERIAAMLELRPEDFDRKNKTMFFRAESRKGSKSDRLIPVPKYAIEAIDEMGALFGPRLFNFPYHTATLYNHLNRILKRAGLPTDRQSKFHRLRKTGASHYKAAGGDPAVLLDHEDPKTTRRYLDPRICGGEVSRDLLEQAIKLLPKNAG